jgi:hypothetical protein
MADAIIEHVAPETFKSLFCQILCDLELLIFLSFSFLVKVLID